MIIRTLYTLLAFLFIPVFGGAYCIGQQDDSIVKRKSSDKYLDVSDVSLYVTPEQDIYLYDIENSSVGAAEPEAEPVSGGKEGEVKRKLVYAGLRYLHDNNNQFISSFYRTLKRTGYADTVNKLFVDNINLIVLGGRIDRVNLYTIGGKKRSKPTARAKMYVTWFLRNSFDEVTDTIHSSAYSGSYVSEYSSVAEYFKNDPERLTTMLEDAFNNTFSNLHHDEKFATKLKYEEDYTIADSVLPIKIPTQVVSNRSEAAAACVIIKTDNGHGSGFAVTNDGYIITSYHVVEEAVGKKLNVVVINAAGEEKEGVVVRYNKYRNIALVKTESKFEKAFRIPAEKSFKSLQDVFTVGSPKSIELGQTMSTGIISAERKVNNNHFIQLNMSINGGNSGGPLFDGEGVLHGMIVAKLSGKNTEGVSFAVPSFLLEHHLKLKFR